MISTGLGNFLFPLHRTIESGDTQTISVRIGHWVTARGSKSGIVHSTRFFHWQTHSPVPWVIIEQ